MNFWLSILIDFGVLALLGTLYYFFQRKRILRANREEILANLEEFRYQLNQFIEESSSSPLHNQLQDFSNKFDSHLAGKNYQDLTTLDTKVLNNNDHLLGYYHALCKQILSHLKITKNL